MSKVETAFRKILGIRPKWVRPPYGASNTDVLNTLKTMGYKAVTWNLDSQDWNGEFYKIASFGQFFCVLMIIQVLVSLHPSRNSRLWEMTPESSPSSTMPFRPQPNSSAPGLLHGRSQKGSRLSLSLSVLASPFRVLNMWWLGVLVPRIQLGSVKSNQWIAILNQLLLYLQKRIFVTSLSVILPSWKTKKTVGLWRRGYPEPVVRTLIDDCPSSGLLDIDREKPWGKREQSADLLELQVKRLLVLNFLFYIFYCMFGNVPKLHRYSGSWRRILRKL